MPPRALGGFPQSVRSKVDRDPTPTLDAPIWSRITANPDIKNRGVISRAGATPGQVARPIPRTWVRSGVFHNTSDETSMVRAPGGRYPSEKVLGLPEGRKAPIAYKWSHSVARLANHVRMRPDPSDRKPSRFPNKTARPVPGPPH